MESILFVHLVIPVVNPQNSFLTGALNTNNYCRSDNPSDCEGGRLTTGVTMDEDDIMFGGDINGTRNPMAFQFSGPWKVRTNLPTLTSSDVVPNGDSS